MTQTGGNNNQRKAMDLNKGGDTVQTKEQLASHYALHVALQTMKVGLICSVITLIIIDVLFTFNLD